MKRLLLLFISFFCLSSASFAQITLNGEVYDDTNKEPMGGATVLVQGTTTATMTDVDGLFRLSVDALPVTLEISFIGFKKIEYEVNSADQEIALKMVEDAYSLGEIEIKGQRVSDKQKAQPLTVESLDIIAIKETPSDNFYDGLGSLKGVDLTAASLGFKVINTRGFNSTSPVRSLQIIDGVDNQSPGLNFSLGNFLGSSELDVLSVDIVAGASSAYYGPNAFNGVINMRTKDPFTYQGLAVMLKGGERGLFEGAVRWANSIKNKDSLDVFAYKFNVSYMRANDWEAENYDPVFDTETGVDNPGRFDAVNIYGDEYFPLNDATTTPPWNDVGLGQWHREGYREIDLVDYGTENIKANAVLQFRLKPEQQEMSPELIVASSFGSGTTVYQGDNRFSLRNILFFQNRLELRKRDKYFIRAYATNENAGDSYDPYATALKLLEETKDQETWSQDYRRYWKNDISGRIDALEYPQLDFVIDPNTGQVNISFDSLAAQQWLVDYNDSLFVWHDWAADAANQANSSNPNTKDFYEPGTVRFQEAFDRIRSAKNNEEENGTLFFDKSALYHIHGEYKFTPTFIDEITVGGNGRLYRPNTDGTIFIDTAGNSISNYEFGAYAGASKSFLGKLLTLNATLRVDKNQNFRWIYTPAASVIIKPRPNNFLRMSFSSALRNPTLADQYLFLDVGPAILSGNLNGADSLITLESFDNYRNGLIRDSLRYFNIDPVQPERVQTFEVGYRTTLFNSLYLDIGYYYSIYRDFLGYNIGLDVEFGGTSDLPTDFQAYRYAANSINKVTTQGFSAGVSYYFADYYLLSGNYSWNRLNKTFEDDPIIPAFNTPEHKFNLGISGRGIPINIGKLSLKNVGFSVNYKWIQGFLFEGSPQFTGFIPTYDLVNAQVNYKVDKWNTTFKLGASNVLNNKQFQTYGGPRIGRLAYFSIVYDWRKF